MTKLNVFWFRRDLRLNDNTALYFALLNKLPVLPIFIFDRNILDELDKNDRRVQFIHETIKDLQHQLEEHGSSLRVFYDTPINVFKEIAETFDINSVFINGDYEPYARERDEQIKSFLFARDIRLEVFKDHVIFEKDEIAKADKTPYHIFTPYSTRWKQLVNENLLKWYPSEKNLTHLYAEPSHTLPALESMGFIAGAYEFPDKETSLKLILDYKKYRNYPAMQGTTRLGVHLRFGTVSIRSLVAEALKLDNTFLDELIWREFFQMILWHYPRLVYESFKKEYDRIPCRNNEIEFEAWTFGKTGFPLVDAGMRELNATGFMHNRVRMVVASFLTKLLLCDWRLGEAYFASHLLDYELASNNGNWQWAAGSGCDAAPYFRIFSPAAQAKKFDPEQKYIKKWIPELNTAAYPEPIIDYKEARTRAIKVYAAALK